MLVVWIVSAILIMCFTMMHPVLTCLLGTNYRVDLTLKHTDTSTPNPSTRKETILKRNLPLLLSPCLQLGGERRISSSSACMFSWVWTTDFSCTQKRLSAVLRTFGPHYRTVSWRLKWNRTVSWRPKWNRTLGPDDVKAVGHQTCRKQIRCYE